MMDNRARDEAAQWFVRLQHTQLSVAERQRFDAWRNEHPDHQYEFDVLQGVWSATDLLPRARLQALCEAPVEKPRRRAVLRYAVAASVVAVALGLGLFRPWIIPSPTVPSSVHAWASSARWHCPMAR